MSTHTTAFIPMDEETTLVDHKQDLGGFCLVLVIVIPIFFIIIIPIVILIGIFAHAK